MADAVSYTVALAVGGTWSAKTDLPLALCNMAVLVAAACVWRVRVLVELTYFWGMTGTLQAVITPDLDVRFPHLVFFQYVVGHVAIVTGALFLVIGLRITPRPGAVRRTFAVTAAYTAFVGIVDWLSGANYMFLRHVPSNWTVLRLLGPWPWYIVSAAAVAIVLLAVLNLPFWYTCHRRSGDRGHDAAPRGGREPLASRPRRRRRVPPVEGGQVSSSVAPSGTRPLMAARAVAARTASSYTASRWCWVTAGASGGSPSERGRAPGSDVGLIRGMGPGS